MSQFLRYLLLPFRAPMLPILVLVSAYLGLDWSLARPVAEGLGSMEGLVWSMECLQSVGVVVVCTLPDLLLRQLSSMMATSRVVSLVASLLLVTLLGIYMLHLQMLANVLILGCSVLLARLDMLRVRLAPPPLVTVALLTVLVLGGASLGRFLASGFLGPTFQVPSFSG
ncbi:MAG: hypothetical protein VKP70_04060 [Cyanobacteriota bacterium]|nr:hypothetical protein [Cyanobacteriota bacterium]